MRTFLPTLAVSALFLNALTAADGAAKAPDAKAGTRLKFQAYDGDEKEQARMTFQINTLDIRQPSEFLKIGDTISKTPLKLKKFVFKQAKDPKTGEMIDVSELTVENIATHVETVLVLDKPILVR